MKHRERLPSPHEVERNLNELRDLIPSLKKAYRWAHPYSLSASKGEGASSGPTVEDDGSVTGVTASVAAGKEVPRRKVADAARKIAAMRTDAMAALDSLEDAMGRDKGYEPDRKWRPKLHRDELRPLEEAQQRREERGGGFGES